jgi:sterol 3beta-glucosyltransferase
MRMHITILTAGSQGDIQPLLVLGTALQARGHVVRFAAPINYRSLIESQQLEHFPMRTDFQQMLEGQGGQQMVASGKNMLQTMRAGQQLMKDNLPLLVEDIWLGSQDTDFLISHVGLSAAAQTAAEASRIPLICVTLQPFYPTREFVHPLWPIRFRLGGGFNRLTGFLMNRLTWQIFKSHVNRLRQESLLLPPQTYAGWQAAIRSAPMLNAYSPQLIKRPVDWPVNQHITGFWHAEPDDEWQPPEDLLTFLTNGDPPVCVTFGSMVPGSRSATQSIVQDVQRLTGLRFVMIGDWEESRNENILVMKSCPYEWLFPRMKLVIHHGGVGTFAATLRAGIPSITIPFLLDQFYWAEVALQIGVSLTTIPYNLISAAALAEAIHRTTTDLGLRKQAEGLRSLLNREEGVAQAIQIIEGSSSVDR